MQTEYKQTTKVDDKEEENADNALIVIPLTKGKEYVTALHYFVINNIDQPQLLRFEEMSLKLARTIKRMVDSSNKKQTDISSFFPIQDTNPTTLEEHL